MKNINSKFWHETYYILWVIIIALIGNYIYELEIDFMPEHFNMHLSFKFILLFFAIVCYAVFYNKFKEDYDKSQKEYYRKLNITNKISMETGIYEFVDFEEIFKEVRKKGKKRIYCLCISIFFLFIYTFDWNAILQYFL